MIVPTLADCCVTIDAFLLKESNGYWPNGKTSDYKNILFFIHYRVSNLVLVWFDSWASF
jgi:hypothetical protein